MPYELPPLPYDYDALAPTIDEQTMRIHHGKHHQAYVTNVNAALEGTEWADHPIEWVVGNLDLLPEDKRAAVRNNGGGHANHSLFWQVMGPNGGGAPSGALAAAIDATFDSVDALKAQLIDAGVKRFGSGWSWLIHDGTGLAVVSTPNQDTPLMNGDTPLLGIDVWEHAYYLNYQNRRPDYLAAWWDVVNWDEVGRRYEAAASGESRARLADAEPGPVVTAQARQVRAGAGRPSRRRRAGRRARAPGRDLSASRRRGRRPPHPRPAGRARGPPSDRPGHAEVAITASAPPRALRRRGGGLVVRDRDDRDVARRQLGRERLPRLWVVGRVEHDRHSVHRGPLHSPGHRPRLAACVDRHNLSRRRAGERPVALEEARTRDRRELEPEARLGGKSQSLAGRALRRAAPTARRRPPERRRASRAGSRARRGRAARCGRARCPSARRAAGAGPRWCRAGRRSRPRTPRRRLGGRRRSPPPRA